MLRSIKIVPFIFGLIVVISTVICKYFQSPNIFLLIILLILICYQIYTNKISNRTYNLEETLVNVSKFIIISGISGFIVARILGVFWGGFN